MSEGRQVAGQEMQKSVFSHFGHSSTIVARARAVRMSLRATPEAQGGRHSARTEGPRRGLSARAKPRRGKGVKNAVKTAFFEEKEAQFSSRGYRPAPLFGRTPPSAVTSRRPPGRRGRARAAEAAEARSRGGSAAQSGSGPTTDVRRRRVSRLASSRARLRLRVTCT